MLGRPQSPYVFEPTSSDKHIGVNSRMSHTLANPDEFTWRRSATKPNIPSCPIPIPGKPKPKRVANDERRAKVKHQRILATK